MAWPGLLLTVAICLLLFRSISALTLSESEVCAKLYIEIYIAQ